MIHLDEAVIVEGKYDKIKLASMIDAPIIETNGFGIYKDKKKMALIRRLANERGIVILTDSDAAGFAIRSYIGGSLPLERVKHAYIPDVYGKERRKNQASAEGKLGVEGLPTAVLLEALQKAGVRASAEADAARRITKADLFDAGLSGGADAANRRALLKKELDLPERLSTNALVDLLNVFLTFEQWQALTEKLGFVSGHTGA